MENEEENEIPPEGLTLLLMLGILLGGTFLINFIVWLFMGDYIT